MYGPDDSRAHTLPLHVPVEQFQIMRVQRVQSALTASDDFVECPDAPDDAVRISYGRQSLPQIPAARRHPPEALDVGDLGLYECPLGSGLSGDDTPEFFVDEGTVVLVAAALQAQQFHRIEYGHHIYLTGIAAVGGLYPVLFHKFAD